MDKIVFKNKFRILDKNKDILRLNSTTDKNGVERYTEGFDSQMQAIAALNLYCIASNAKIIDYELETYAEQASLIVPITKDEDINKGLAKMKVFSGKGIQFNTDFHTRKEDNKYKADKFYSREVWMAQSTERNKGLSLVHKQGDKKKFKSSGYDKETADKIQALSWGRTNVPDGQIDMWVRPLLKMKFDNARAVHVFLKQKGYTNRQAKKIFVAYYKATK